MNLTSDNEIWKAVSGFEGMYEVSSCGRIKSLSRLDSKNRKLKEKILKPFNNNGYLQINLGGKTFLIHQIVAIEFLNHKPNSSGLVVNHLDFNRSNNNYLNLEIVSVRQNVHHSLKKGSSKYIGVSLCKNKKWLSKICINGRVKILGRFETEIEAHNAYQEKLKTTI